MRKKPAKSAVFYPDLELLRQAQVNTRKRSPLASFLFLVCLCFCLLAVARPQMPVRVVDPLAEIMIAIDTSGSIEQDSLSLFFKELFHIWRNGAEVMVVECDFTIRRKYLYKGQVVQYALGKGGTNFNPPLQYANEEYMPDALIYFTDGHAPPPKIKSRSPILWIVSPDGITLDSERWKRLPGRKVKMEYLNVHK